MKIRLDIALKAFVLTTALFFVAAMFSAIASAAPTVSEASAKIKNDVDKNGVADVGDEIVISVKASAGSMYGIPIPYIFEKKMNADQKADLSPAGGPADALMAAEDASNDWNGNGNVDADVWGIKFAVLEGNTTGSVEFTLIMEDEDQMGSSEESTTAKTNAITVNQKLPEIIIEENATDSINGTMEGESEQQAQVDEKSTPGFEIAAVAVAVCLVSLKITKKKD